MPKSLHLPEELSQTGLEVQVLTRNGILTGGKSLNGCAVFLEVPYALPPKRFMDPERLPDAYQYPEGSYIYERSYAVQPDNDGQATGVPQEAKLGFGKPTENPLFLNIVCPPSFETLSELPVKVYIHGGFLQFGSPHGLSSQAQYIAEERKEIWVNVGYRLSAFGFLASDEPYIPGNFGFKDQWLALEWIRENISSFSGNPQDVQIVGLSAGAHSCHQLLHHASHLPMDQPVPFQSAFLMSNAISLTPKTPSQLRFQFDALVDALRLRPESALQDLSDPVKVPWQQIVKVIEEDRLGVKNGTFRGCTDNDWLHDDPMGWQASGAFAEALKARGIGYIILGDLQDEWYLYSIAHSISTPADVAVNLERYYPEDFVQRLSNAYPPLSDDAGPEACAKRFGVLLSDGQVHMPVRVLARDLTKSHFNVIRYAIKWVPPAFRPLNYVTHATDRPLWGFRLDMLRESEVWIAKAWLDAMSRAVQDELSNTSAGRLAEHVLTLNEDQTISWATDDRWDDMIRLAEGLGL